MSVARAGIPHCTVFLLALDTDTLVLKTCQTSDCSAFFLKWKLKHLPPSELPLLRGYHLSSHSYLGGTVLCTTENLNFASCLMLVWITLPASQLPKPQIDH